MSFNLLDYLNPVSEAEEVPEGQMAILSVGRGDMKINFNSDDPEDVERARVIVQDMLQRGYMIFIEVDGEQIRVKDFDPKTDEYIIKIDKRTKLWKNHGKNKEEPEKPKKSTSKRVSAKKARGTAIAPTGGG